MLCVAIDACFRLKRRDVSSTEKDPILGSGWGYFVEDEGYQAIIGGYGSQDEVCFLVVLIPCSMLIIYTGLYLFRLRSNDESQLEVCEGICRVWGGCGCLCKA